MRPSYQSLGIMLSLILLTVSVPVLIIAATVQIYSNSAELYKAGFNKYNISQKTRISSQQLDKAAQQMVDYFSGRSQTPQLAVTINQTERPLYNEKELLHLEDVFHIVQLFTRLQIISILVFIVLVIFLYLNRRLPELLNAIQIGAIITVSLTAILVAWALIDFNSLFLLFHYMSFSNNLWILNPATDYLIMLFPEGFFNDAAVMIIITILIEAAIIWVAVFFISKMYAGKQSANK